MNERFVLRPCRVGDLDAVERIAAASAIGIGSLPADRDRLYAKIGASAEAFASDADLSGEETYFFVLEDVASGAIVGTSGIAAAAGFGDRFYSYRNEFVVHASAALNASNKIHTLHLCHDLTGSSLLTSFYIEPALEATPWPALLSRARLLFMAEHPKRFAQRLAAEFPGPCDEAGHSPFWDAVGRRFFGVGYPQAEQLAGGRSKSFIAELMPQYPVYVPLLPPQAQLAIGQLHPAGELPFQLLAGEGFEADTYVDIFDGGPAIEGDLTALASVRCNRRVQVTRSAGGAGSPASVPHLIASTSAQRFRASVAALPRHAEEAALPPELLERLELSDGDDVRVVELNLEAL